jgi:hypothetical protein
VASPIIRLRSVQNSTVGMLLYASSSLESTDTSDRSAARSSSQISAQFRRDLVATKSGAFDFLRRNRS